MTNFGIYREKNESCKTFFFLVQTVQDVNNHVGGDKIHACEQFKWKLKKKKTRLKKYKGKKLY